ncbi:MAG: preprotein translocase subunit SecE [Pseudobdellovibrionaceae bacterium]
MANPFSFFKEVRSETKKVSWPSKDETVKSAIAVFVMVAILSVFLFFADQVMGWMVGLILE